MDFVRRWRSSDRGSEPDGGQAFGESILVLRIRAVWERWRRFAGVFRASHLGMIGLFVLLVFVAMAATAPVLTSLGLLRNPNAPLCGPDYHYCLPTDSIRNAYRGPNDIVWLGTDQGARDIFSRLWWGTQVTILIGLVASMMSMGLGVFIGMVAGYYGGWVDELLMRITDFFLVLPTLVLALILAAYFQQATGGQVTTLNVIFVIGIGLWSSTARLVRSQVLSLKQRHFVERARAIGARDSRIVWYHIFPNAFSIVFAEAILTISVAIFVESFLSFLGLGPRDAYTWGRMIEDADRNAAVERGLIWWIISPGLAIVGVVLGFTLLGYALDEIFNPRLRKR